MWMHENNGSYYVKNGYKAIQSWKTSSISNPSISSPDSHLWKKLWALHTIPRHKTILWRILNNSLPVKSELDKRGIHCIPLCPRCHTKVETLNHIFMSCPLITRTWFGSCLSLKIMEQPIHDFKDWIANIILTEKEDLIIQIGSLTYNIWQVRNQQVFEDLTIHEVDIIQRSERCINEFIQANSPSSSPDISTPHCDRPVLCPRPKRWIKPEAGWVKANNDANLQQPTKWGLGAIIRDEMGLVMVSAEWEMSGYGDAQLAEAYALLQTVRLAIDCGFKRMVFEGDNEKVFNLVQNDISDIRSYLGRILNEIQKLQSQIDTCRFSVISRAANSVAHNLAHLAHSDPNRIWIEEVPYSTQEVYFHDLAH